jgi:endophilin-B
MNFNLKAAGTLLSRAKQFTEEKLGQVTDRTEYDDNFEQLLARADRTKLWTEKLTSHVETVLQPNPNERLEDFILTKLDQKSLNKANIYEQLGHCMCEAGNDFGPSTQYGSTLIKCGHSHQKLGQVHKEFVQSAANGFMQPLKSFLDGEMKSLTKERRTLEMKRLVLDAARSKKKKTKMTNNNVPMAMADSSDTELRHTQAEFDRQLEITRLMLDGLNNSHNHHLRCLNDFVESELQYHQQSLQILEDLRKQLGLSKSTTSNSSASSSSTTTRSNPSPRTAIVKFDYDASDTNELSILAKETVNIILDDNDKLSNDSDWITIEKPSTKERGRVPRAYLRLDSLS